MHPFDKSERQLGSKNPIQHKLVNDYGFKSSYELGEIIDAIIEEYSVYEYVEPKKNSFIRRLAIVVLYPVLIVSMPIKWLFTGTYYYDTHKGIGKYLKKILID